MTVFKIPYYVTARMPRKLEFHVVHASGEDDIHKAGDLNYHGPLAKGWVASRYTFYCMVIATRKVS